MSYIYRDKDLSAYKKIIKLDLYYATVNINY